MTPTKIEIQGTIQAPIQKVWDYYTQPEHITQWNFADPSWCCPSATNDMKVGGKYCARMEAKDGSFGFDFEATYDSVSLYNGFTYTMPDQRSVAVDFHAVDDGTEVKVVFDAETENDVEMQRGGWQAILNNFKSYVEKA